MEVAPQGKTVVQLIWHRCCCLTSSVHPCRTLNHLPLPRLYNTNGVPPLRCNLWIDTGSARCKKKKGASTMRGTKKVEGSLKKNQCMITTVIRSCLLYKTHQYEHCFPTKLPLDQIHLVLSPQLECAFHHGDFQHISLKVDGLSIS